jgi:hypothetical protein
MFSNRLPVAILNPAPGFYFCSGPRFRPGWISGPAGWISDPALILGFGFQGHFRVFPAWDVFKGERYPAK